MAKVKGIGGIFFKSKDPEKLADWYKTHLGLEIEASFGGSVFHASNLHENAYAIWTPFKDSTTYFEPSRNAYMINLIVDDLTEALEQVKKGGATVVGEREDSEFGAFGWFIDPEDNKVELWQPV